MPDTTPTLAIPFPVGADDADVPSNMENLANQVETIMLRGGEIATHVPVAGDEGKMLICQADGHLAYKAIHGDIAVADDGTVTIQANSLSGAELQDDSVDARALDAASVDNTILTANTAAGLLPVGSIVMTARSTLPTADWLWCDGSSYLRADPNYSALYAAIGTTYGAADGTHFSVPNGRGRTPVGAGAGAGLTNRALGGTGGEENHVLGTGEIPPHSHILNSVGITGIDGTGSGPGGWTISAFSNPGSTVTDGGGGGAHNNMQPFWTPNFMILRRSFA